MDTRVRLRFAELCFSDRLVTVAPEGDKYISLIDKALEGLSIGATPGAFMVDFFPWRKCPCLSSV